MLRRYLLKNPLSGNGVIKNLTTIMWPSNHLLKDGWKTMQKEFNFLKIHGPTGEDVLKDVDLTGKTCLITGANSGLGLEMTRCLSGKNCEVLMACRNVYAANQVIKQSCDHTDLLRLYEVNLASLKSVSKCVNNILERETKIDIVILNAAVFGLPWTLTEDGWETIFQVNFLSQYYLLKSLECILAPNARVVVMSSESHRYVNWPSQNILAPTFEQLSLPKDMYTSIRAYNASKLSLMLLANYLSYRWSSPRRYVLTVSPGAFVWTGLCRNWWLWEYLYISMVPFVKSVAQATATPLYCAVTPDLREHCALYYKNMKPRDPSPLATDLRLAARVLDLAEEMLDESLRVKTEVKDSNESVNEMKADKEAEVDEALNVPGYNKIAEDIEKVAIDSTATATEEYTAEEKRGRVEKTEADRERVASNY